MSLNLLITGAGGGSGLYSIKILKETTEHYIIGVDASPFSPGIFLADEGYVFPLARDEDAFLKAIRDMVSRKNIDAIIPNVDEELPLLSRPDVRNTLGAKVVVSPHETIVITSDKSTTVDALKHVIPCPLTMRANEDLSNIHFPVHVKPAKGRGSRHTYRLDDAQALEECLRQLEGPLDGRQNILVQEFLPGREYTVDALCDFDGEPILIVPRVRLRVSSGLSVQGVTVRDLRLIGFVETILKTLKFFGPINLQFREDADGVPKLMEINPRFSGGLPIVSAAGANSPMLLAALIEGANPADLRETQKNWQEGVILRYLEEMFFPLEEWNTRFKEFRVP